MLNICLKSMLNIHCNFTCVYEYRTGYLRILYWSLWEVNLICKPQNTCQVVIFICKGMNLFASTDAFMYEQLLIHVPSRSTLVFIQTLFSPHVIQPTIGMCIPLTIIYRRIIYLYSRCVKSRQGIWWKYRNLYRVSVWQHREPRGSASCSIWFYIRVMSVWSCTKNTHAILKEQEFHDILMIKASHIFIIVFVY